MDDSPLATLSPEIRNNIWALSLAPNHPIIPDETSFKTDIALTQTCHEIRQETRLMFFRLHHFVMKRFYRVCIHRAEWEEKKPLRKRSRCAGGSAGCTGSRCHRSLNILHTLGPQILSVMRSITICRNLAWFPRSPRQAQPTAVVVEKLGDSVRQYNGIVKVMMALRVFLPVLVFYHNAGFKELIVDPQCTRDLHEGDKADMVEWLTGKTPWMARLFLK